MSFLLLLLLVLLLLLFMVLLHLLVMLFLLLLLIFGHTVLWWLLSKLLDLLWHFGVDLILVADVVEVLGCSILSHWHLTIIDNWLLLVVLLPWLLHLHHVLGLWHLSWHLGLDHLLLLRSGWHIAVETLTALLVSGCKVVHSWLLLHKSLWLLLNQVLGHLLLRLLLLHHHLLRVLSLLVEALRRNLS